MEIIEKKEETIPIQFLDTANRLGMAVEDDGIVHIPEKYGKGYAKIISIGSEIIILIRDYELYEDFKINRTNTESLNERVIIVFNNVSATETRNQLFQSVQVFSGNIDSEIIYPGKRIYKSINIGIETAFLKTLIGTDIEIQILKLITDNHSSFLFEELISPQIQKVTNGMLEAEIPPSLQKLYFKSKVEELICLLFIELMKRENTSVSPINTHDVQTIYSIRDKIISDLGTPPILAKLAVEAGMSESKMKRLFKQIFGNSIFSYYQDIRMKKAALLLKENKLSVSEVGYELGFTNLSHFSNVFEQHIGMKPKKYSKTYFKE